MVDFSFKKFSACVPTFLFVCFFVPVFFLFGGDV